MPKGGLHRVSARDRRLSDEFEQRRRFREHDARLVVEAPTAGRDGAGAGEDVTNGQSAVRSLQREQAKVRWLTAPCPVEVRPGIDQYAVHRLAGRAGVGREVHLAR